MSEPLQQSGLVLSDEVVRWVRFGYCFVLGFLPGFVISFMIGDLSGNAGRVDRITIWILATCFLLAMVMGPEIRRRPWLGVLAPAFLVAMGIFHHMLPLWFGIPISD